jgi:hypothetical protein
MARSFRLHRPFGHYSQQGDMVIRGVVRARLLGMQILTLEARVVVGTDDGHPAITPPLILSPDAPSHSISRSSEPGPASVGSGRGLLRAMELLEQGIDTLERSRRRR